MLFLGRPLSHASAASFLRTRQVAATCVARRSVAVRGISSVYAEQRRGRLDPLSGPCSVVQARLGPVPCTRMRSAASLAADLRPHRPLTESCGQSSRSVARSSFCVAHEQARNAAKFVHCCARAVGRKTKGPAHPRGEESCAIGHLQGPMRAPRHWSGRRQRNPGGRP